MSKAGGPAKDGKAAEGLEEIDHIEDIERKINLFGVSAR
jgi:hypothetical protein